jgi:hypothetical protein
VSTRLREFGLQVDTNKCDFGAQEVKYLGLFITTNGVRMDPEKIEATTEWQIPTSMKDVQAFLGLANSYQRFVHAFSRIVHPVQKETRMQRRAETEC